MKQKILTILIATSAISVITATSITSVYAEGKHKGGHGAGAHWMSPPEAAKKPNPIKSDSASIDRGKKSYFQYCSSCHGPKAMGNSPAAASFNPRPSNLVAMAGGHPDGDFAWKIANGRGAMPAWKSLLSENQIWDLVNYIQNLNPNGKKMDMSTMDHSNMSKEDMEKMMGNMKGGGHSDSDGHHDEKPKKTAKEKSHDDGHSH